MGKDSDQSGQMSGQQGAPKTVNQMLTTLTKQSTEVPNDLAQRIEEDFQNTRNFLVRASSLNEKDLQADDLHDTVQETYDTSQLTEKTQQWISEVLYATDDESSRQDPKFQQACADSISKISQLFSWVGIQTPAAAQQYASQSGTSSSTSRGRHTGRPDGQ